MSSLPSGRLRTVAALAVAATFSGLVTAVSAAPAAAAPAAQPAKAAPAAPKCTPPNFTRQFFSNTSFSGTPKKEDCDPVVDQNWKNGAPAAGLPSDRFGVRWSMTRDFGSGGPFTFTASARDGVRVYLDGKRKINLWENGSATRKKTVNVTVPAGEHTLRVDYVNWTGAANVAFSYPPRTAASVDKVKPLAPTGLTASLDNATAQARLKWTANRELDLADYRVYRRHQDGGAFQHVKTVTTTSYAEVPPEAGQTYSYEVRARDRAGNTSAGSADRPVTTIDVTAPAGLAARGEDAGIKVSWKPVHGAVRYRVLRGGELLRTTNAASLTDTGVERSKKWSYQVAAVDGANRVSPYTDAYNPAAEARRLVAAPHDVTAKPSPETDRPVLSWKVDPATGGDYYGYRVYRSASRPVDTTTEPVRCTTEFTKLPDGRLHYTCTDRSAEQGATHHYVIKGYDSRLTESVASATATVTTPPRDYTPPAKVTGVTAEATAYGVVLKWKANTEPDLKRYVIHVGELIEAEDGQQICYAAETDYLGPDATTYLAERLPNGEKACYFVDPVDTSGNSHFKATRDAEIVVVTEPDLTPSVPTPDLSPVTLTATRDGAAVDLAWEAVPDATGYLVQRWNPASRSYEKLTTRPAGDLSFRDGAAPSGTTHFYWVSALYADGTTSAPGGDWVIVPPVK